MIAYEELERALGRWKARRGHQEVTENNTVGGLPEPRERTGEIDMGDVVETYDEAP
jgi:hypothetical protein